MTDFLQAQEDEARQWHEVHSSINRTRAFTRINGSGKRDYVQLQESLVEFLEARVQAERDAEARALVEAARWTLSTTGHYAECLAGLHGQPLGNSCSVVCQKLRAALQPFEGASE